MSNRLSWRIAVLAAALVQSGAAQFRASAVKADITPEKSTWLLGYDARRSEGVHDRLYHRVAAMDDGRTRFVLVSSDLAVIAPDFYDDFSRELQRETGIPPERFWWTVTHTHSAPEVGPPGLAAVWLGGRYQHEPDAEYTALVRKSLLEAVKRALAQLAPARLGVGAAVSLANMNRRARDVGGRIFLGSNPEGPVDRQVGLIRLERPDGSPIALVANYAMHGTVLGPKNLLISGDAPGLVAQYVEEKLNAVVLFVNGAAGNVAPLYSVAADFKSGNITQFNVLLGDRILAGNRDIPAASADVTLRTGQSVLETPRKPGMPWPDAMAGYLRRLDGDKALVRMPLRFLRIGPDTVIWAAPMELFCEIAIDIRNRSPFPRTFYFGYANGSLGYLPTARAFGEGGYELKVTPFTEKAEEDVTRAVLAYLEGFR